MILLVQLVARKEIDGHILSRVVDVWPGQKGIRDDPGASTCPDHAVGTEIFPALSMNSTSVEA